MVFGFVRQSGGAMNVRSVVGKGTTVELLLPHAERSAADEPDGSDASHPAPIPFASALLVDDDEGVRSVVREHLVDLGLAVECAEDGPRALALVDKDPSRFDLVITDLSMPGMNGVELIDELAVSCPDARIVLMTGFIDDAVVDRLAPSVLRLRKPVTSGELREALSAKV
jgi:CheY-like chemotaxis protein